MRYKKKHDYKTDIIFLKDPFHFNLHVVIPENLFLSEMSSSRPVFHVFTKKKHLKYFTTNEKAFITLIFVLVQTRDVVMKEKWPWIVGVGGCSSVAPVETHNCTKP